MVLGCQEEVVHKDYEGKREQIDYEEKAKGGGRKGEYETRKKTHRI